MVEVEVEGNENAIEQEEHQNVSQLSGPRPFSLDLSQVHNYQEVGTTNHHGLISFFEDGQCMEKGQLVIKVVCQEKGIDISSSVEVAMDPAQIREQAETEEGRKALAD
jgi:hypothetical protein